MVDFAQQLATRSTMTEKEFGVVMVKLAMQLGAQNVDVAVIKSYYEALQDLSLDAVKAAAQILAREPGRRFMPETPIWRDTAREWQEQQLRAALPHVRQEPWHFECEICHDTGWQEHLDGTAFSCPAEPCGRTKPHGEHTWTRPCHCRATNRSFLRRLKFGSGE